VGIGTTTPEASSILDVESTTQGFLPPRMNTTERNAINGGAPAEGLTIYNTESKCLETYDGASWISICDGSVLTLANNCDPTNPTAVVDVTNTFTGETWMDRNLGATAVTQTARGAYPDDAAYIAAEEASFGHLYQWGRAADGHQCRTSSTSTYDVFETTNPGVANFTNDPGNAWYGQFILRNSGIVNNWVDPSATDGTITVNDLWQGVNGTNNPCPNGYRLPTEVELDAERLSWVEAPISSTNNRAGAFASPLKLPAAGNRSRISGSLQLVGSDGRYWSSTVAGTDARRNFFSSSNAGMATSNRAFGVSVRCIKD
jgi:uncharacterized protein (TIGR02145 family)